MVLRLEYMFHCRPPTPRDAATPMEPPELIPALVPGGEDRKLVRIWSRPWSAPQSFQNSSRVRRTGKPPPAKHSFGGPVPALIPGQADGPTTPDPRRSPASPGTPRSSRRAFLRKEGAKTARKSRRDPSLNSRPASLRLDAPETKSGGRHDGRKLARKARFECETANHAAL